MEQYSATIKGNFYAPKGEGPFPAVILMHGCGGAKKGKESLNAHASALRSQGFSTLVLDSFGPRGLSRQCNNLQLAYARDYRLYDAFNTLVALQDHPLVDPNNVFLVGQSNGGSVALLATGGGGSIHVNMDPNLQFKAIVAYYPWCGVPMSPLVSPLLVFGAGKDDWVSAEECERKKKFVSGKSMEVVIYPNAEHAFDLSIHSQIYEGRRVGGLKSARDDSRKRMIDFFKKHLGN